MPPSPCAWQEKTEQLSSLLSGVEALYDSIKDCPFEAPALLQVMQARVYGRCDERKTRL